MDKNKKLVNKLAQSFDGFLASQRLIAQIPKLLGPGLYKAGKFPTSIKRSDDLVQVNKLFEDYVYAYITYALQNSKYGVQEYMINRARKNKTALLRNAKIRMSNIHPGRLLQNLRGRDKWMK